LLDANADFADNELKRVYGSVVVEPWSSKVLFSGTSGQDKPMLEIIGTVGDFGKREEGSVSESRWFIACVRNLSADLVISAPEGFIISRNSDRDFSTTLTVPAKQQEQDFLIFVKFAPQDSKGYYGFVEISSGVIARQVRVKGTSR
jgi:hypothetical protein